MRHYSRWFLLVLVATHILAADFAVGEPPKARPRQTDDYGWMHRQQGAVFELPPQHVLVNWQAVRSEVPGFHRFHPRQYPQIISQMGLSFLTHLQQSWEGILMETLGESVATVDAYHPQTYIRGSVVFPVLQLGQQLIEMHASDLKGTGLSPEGELKLRLYHTALTMILQPEEGASEQLDFGRLKVTLQRHRDQLRVAHERVQKRKVETPLDKSNRDKTLDTLGRELEVTQYLLLGMHELKTTKTTSEKVRAKILNAIRGLDYTNGLLPFDRALKEYLMGIAWSIYFKRYNAKHGTELSVVEPYAVFPLPVNILLPNGKKTRAGVLWRRAHWRNQTNAEFAKMFPEAVVDPVIGGIQTDIFGQMVDLELPGLQVGPPFNLLRSGPFGHPIDRACEVAAAAWLDGNVEPLEKLIADVEKLTNEAPIPDEPFPVKGKVSDGSKLLRAMLEKLDRIEAPIDAALVTEALALLERKDITDSEKAALSIRMTSIDSNVGIQIIRRELAAVRERTENIARRPGHAIRINAALLTGPLMTLLQRFDPLALQLSSEGPGTLFDELFALPHQFYRSVIAQLSRSVYVALGHTLGLEDLIFDEQSSVWELLRTAILAMVDLHEIDRRTPPGEPLVPPATVPNPVGDVPMPFEKLLDHLRGETMRPVLHHILFTAERFTGQGLSPRMLALIDPDDASGIAKFRRVAKAQQTVVRGHVDRLVGQGNDLGCALMMVSQAIQQGTLPMPME